METRRARCIKEADLDFRGLVQGQHEDRDTCEESLTAKGIVIGKCFVDGIQCGLAVIE